MAEDINKTKNSGDQNDPPPPSKMELWSDDLEKIRADLDILYIPRNQSARIRFTKKHQFLASYLFGDELIDYDNNGVGENQEHRKELERQAEHRYDAFQTLLQELEEKSTLYGTLQTEYVEGVVNRLGREVALLVYARKIVDRIIPPAPGEPAPLPSQENDTMQPSLPDEPDMSGMHIHDIPDRVAPMESTAAGEDEPMPAQLQTPPEAPPPSEPQIRPEEETPPAPAPVPAEPEVPAIPPTQPELPPAPDPLPQTEPPAPAPIETPPSPPQPDEAPVREPDRIAPQSPEEYPAERPVETPPPLSEPPSAPKVVTGKISFASPPQPVQTDDQGGEKQ